MVKFDLDFKLKVIEQYLAGASSPTLAHQYHIANRTTVLLWVKRFKHYGVKGLNSRVIHPKYTREFKVEVLNWMQKQNASLTETALNFDISAPSTVWQWQRAFQSDGISGLLTNSERNMEMSKNSTKKQSSKPAVKEPRPQEIRDLEERITRLEIENAYLKKLDALARQKSFPQSK